MTQLIDTQAMAFAAVDALLPAPPAVPEPPDVSVHAPDGTPVVGGVYREVHDPDDVSSLWEARTVWELTAVVGSAGAGGMDAVLRAFRSWLHAHAGPATGDAARVPWPSRDVAMSPALLAHGFIPATVLAVRRPGPGRPATAVADGLDDVTIRRATPEDVDELVRIHSAELTYSADVLGRPLPANADELLTTSLHRAVFFSGRVLLAERDGIAVGAVDCGITSPEPASTLHHRLPEGRWGYIGTLSVLPSARGCGIGTALATAAHRMLDAEPVAGTFLFYEPANPLSSVFWPRLGYRPLWTKWTARPIGRFLG